eukprot:6345113-Prymnesium_polylepis.1
MGHRPSCVPVVSKHSQNSQNSPSILRTGSINEISERVSGVKHELPELFSGRRGHAHLVRAAWLCGVANGATAPTAHRLRAR